MSEVLHLYTESRDAPVARLDLARREVTLLVDPAVLRRQDDHERYAWQLRVASP
jgi:hypothetical protein